VTAPRARLAFRIGLVGHRPNRLPHDEERLGQLRHTIRVIVQEARAAAGAATSGLYSNEAPILRAISPLAEGADRIFAEEALAEDYELYSPLPFAQEEFEQDFLPPAALQPDSLSHFRSLLERARDGAGLGLFEMDGTRSRAPEAYSAAGRIVLNQADLLIGVWDGKASAGVGGTVDTLGEAILYHVPVIWIDAGAPDRWQMLHAMPPAGDALPPQQSDDALRDCVRRIVTTEAQMPSGGAADAQAFFAEGKPRLNAAFFWTLFRDIITDGKFHLEFFLPDFEVQIKQEWPISQDGAAPVSPLSNWINTQLRPHFAWADGLADYYAGAHRSSFIACYLLSALAVVTALLPMAAGWTGTFQTVCIIVEFLILASILFLLHLARKRHWHERWTDYRLLAELIRQLRFLIPLGGGKPLPRVAAHLAVYGDPARSWMYWHVRAIARQTGVPSARVTPVYVHDCLDFLGRVVGDANSGQWGFHLASERRGRVLAKRLRDTALVFFWLTMLGIIVRLSLWEMASHLHMMPASLDRLQAVADRWLVLAAASLPALGAALEGISNQGEFVRIAKRSAAMVTGFAAHADALSTLQKDATPHLTDVTPLSSKIATAMVDEVVDWRMVFVDRPQ
jgi:hypothetical protein